MRWHHKIFEYHSVAFQDVRTICSRIGFAAVPVRHSSGSCSSWNMAGSSGSVQYQFQFASPVPFVSFIVSFLWFHDEKSLLSYVKRCGFFTWFKWFTQWLVPMPPTSENEFKNHVFVVKLIDFIWDTETLVFFSKPIFVLSILRKTHWFCLGNRDPNFQAFVCFQMVAGICKYQK